MSAGKLHRQTLTVPGTEQSETTDVVVGAGALDATAELLAEWLSGRTLFVVSSPMVRELHGHVLAPVRRRAAHTVELEVPDGEPAKKVEIADRLWSAMLERGGKRSSRLLTFGGGSVGDLGGFVAGCFLRGIEFVQVPTTLLAQVDASIGGKTGVDLAGGKNTVGLFHHPRWVISDTELLASLPREELRSGLVEAIKMGAVVEASRDGDPPLFERIERDLEALLDGEAEALAPVVTAAAGAKISVVEGDPKEGDQRRILNFGHTLGHAIEGALGYSGLRHGEAVAYGMLFAVRLAERRHGGAAGVDPVLGIRLRQILERLELPPLPTLDPEVLWTFMTRDKKATETGIAWVLPTGAGGEPFGRAEMVSGIPRRIVMAELRAFLEEPFAL